MPKGKWEELRGLADDDDKTTVRDPYDSKSVTYHK